MTFHGFSVPLLGLLLAVMMLLGFCPALIYGSKISLLSTEFFDDCESDCSETIYYYNYYQNYHEVGPDLYSSYCAGSTVQLAIESCFQCLTAFNLWDTYRHYVQTPLMFCGYNVPIDSSVRVDSIVSRGVWKNWRLGNAGLETENMGDGVEGDRIEGALNVGHS